LIFSDTVQLTNLQVLESHFVTYIKLLTDLCMYR